MSNTSVARVIAPPYETSPERVNVQVDFGPYGIRTLRYDADAMDWLKKKTGKNPMRGEWMPGMVTDLVYFFYACTLSTQETEGALTLAQVADSINIVHFKEAFGLTMRLMTNRDATQSGELAPYVPTHPKVVKKALQVAGLQSGEVFLDLGCGDGRALAMASQMGATVYGYELNDNRAKVAARMLHKLGAVGEVFTGDLMAGQWLTLAPNVVFCYLLGDAMRGLKPLLEQLPAGTRVISHDFLIEGWDVAQSVELMAEDRPNAHNVHLYVMGKHMPVSINMALPISDEDADYLAGMLQDALKEFEGSEEKEGA